MVDLITAAGPENCNETITYTNADAGEDVTALILPDTPSVLSLGMCVIDMGWHFEWPAHSFAPFAIKPDGTVAWLVVRDYAPYFRRAHDQAPTGSRVSPTVAAAPGTSRYRWG